MAQVVYYFYAAVRLGAPERAVAFAVPTGNFGDVFAGYVAAQMGLPIARLIVATNVNDILHRALSQRRLFGEGVRQPTADPVDGHPGQLELRAAAVRSRRARRRGAGGADGRVRGDERDAADQRAARRARPRCSPATASISDDMTPAMRWAHERAGQVIDPHTAIGLAAARAPSWPPTCPS